MAKLEGRAREIIADGRNYVVLSIPRADGTVQAVVAWAAVEDDRIAVNSAEGRAWPANLRRAGTATVTAFADGDPYEWVSATCRLVDDTHEGAVEHIHALARKYLGTDYPWLQEGEQRIRFALAPERVQYVKQ
jgi:hypothetical protein